MCRRQYLGPWERKFTGTVDNCMMMNCKLYISHEIFLERSNGEEDMSKECGIYGEE